MHSVFYGASLLLCTSNAIELKEHIDTSKFWDRTLIYYDTTHKNSEPMTDDWKSMKMP